MERSNVNPHPCCNKINNLCLYHGPSIYDSIFANEVSAGNLVFRNCIWLHLGIFCFPLLSNVINDLRNEYIIATALIIEIESNYFCID